MGLARELRAKTTLPLAWIALRLNMGSRGHLAWLLQQHRAHRDAGPASQGLLESLKSKVQSLKSRGLTCTFPTQMDLATARRVGARGLQVRTEALVGRVPPRGDWECEMSRLGWFMQFLRVGKKSACNRRNRFCGPI